MVKKLVIVLVVVFALYLAAEAAGNKICNNLVDDAQASFDQGRFQVALDTLAKADGMLSWTDAAERIPELEKTVRKRIAREARRTAQQRDYDAMVSRHAASEEAARSRDAQADGSGPLSLEEKEKLARDLVEKGRPVVPPDESGKGGRDR